MITRKIGKLIRGKATPFQLALACVLGSMIGFVPGLVQGPGLLILLLCLLAVLNANLFVATLVFLASKLLSLALMGVSFAIGRVLLDGPTGGLFETMINAPVLALMGFDYYVTTGGLVLGAVFGAGSAVVVAGGVTKLRTIMAGLEEGSEKYNALKAKWYVKWPAWALFGGLDPKKGSFADLASKKVGLPVRPIGVVAVVLLLALGGLVAYLSQGEFVTAALKAGLERANGATVDVGSVDVDLASGSLTVEALAVADPENLDKDLLKASRVDADIDAAALLSKRISFDRVEVSDATSGSARAVRGRLVGKKAADTGDPGGAAEAESKGIESYVKDAATWKGRLAQAQRWKDKLGGERPGGAPAGDGSSGGPDAAGESLRDRLERQVALLGYANVRAEHLVRGSPTVVVELLTVNGLGVDNSEVVLDVSAANLSTQPWLLAEGPRVDVVERSGRYTGRYAGDPAGPGTLRVEMKGVPGDEVSRALSSDTLIQGGTVDGVLESSVVGDRIDGTLRAVLTGSTIEIDGVGSTTLERFELPIGVTGRVGSPRISVPREALEKALRDAGEEKLLNKAEEELGGVLDDALGDSEEKEKVEEAVGGLLDRVRSRKRGGDGGG